MKMKMQRWPRFSWLNDSSTNRCFLRPGSVRFGKTLNKSRWLCFINKKIGLRTNQWSIYKHEWHFSVCRLLLSCVMVNTHLYLWGASLVHSLLNSSAELPVMPWLYFCQIFIILKLRASLTTRKILPICVSSMNDSMSPRHCTGSAHINSMTD